MLGRCGDQVQDVWSRSADFGINDEASPLPPVPYRAMQVQRMEAVMNGNWNSDIYDGIGWGWALMAIMMLLVWGSLIWLAVAVALLRRTRHS